MVLEDETGNGSLKVQVYLPPCYPADGDIPYPLLVLLHGQGYDQNHWLSLDLADTADKLISSAQIPPMIILMPHEEYAYYHPYDSSFDAVIINLLLPWVAENFAACQEARCRGVGGISRGGSWALHMGSDYPGVFGVIGMHSAAPFSADQYRLVRVLRDLPEPQRPRLFIDVGEIDTYRGFISEFHEDLAEQDVEHTWNTAEGGHDGAYWRAHIEDYLLWYGAVLAPPK
jgi:enterochelin esterase-like enzyme